MGKPELSKKILVRIDPIVLRADQTSIQGDSQDYVDTKMIGTEFKQANAKDEIVTQYFENTDDSREGVPETRYAGELEAQSILIA
ncbi:hypothetical protein D6D17_02337 [Aureobasidium pullulans]|nr:hypothetical protein D6D17_02337 [Aureobasidium pullulans]